MSTTPLANARPKALAQDMATFLAGSPAMAAAGTEAMNLLVAPSWSGPDEVSLVARALLGDIAIQSQDYVVDALHALHEARRIAAIRGTNPWVELMSRSSSQARLVFEATRDAWAPGETLWDFMEQALRPLEFANLH